MADIQITLEATEAIKEAKALDATLDKLEISAKSVKGAFKNLRLKLDTTGVSKSFNELKKRIKNEPIILHTRLSKKIAFVTDYNKIKAQISLHSKSKPIILYTKLAKSATTIKPGPERIDITGKSGEVLGSGKGFKADDGTKITKELEKQNVLEKKISKGVKSVVAGTKDEILKRKKIAQLQKKAIQDLKTFGGAQKKLMAAKAADAATKPKPTTTPALSENEKNLKAAEKTLAAQRKGMTQVANMSKAKKKIYHDDRNALRGNRSEVLKAIEAENALGTATTSSSAAQRDHTKATKGSIVSHRGFNKTTKELNKSLEGSTIKEITGALGEEKQKIMASKDELNKGNISRRQFNKTLRTSRKRIRGLTKEMTGMKKGGGIMASMFGRITMSLTAVAATLFILQSVKQWINALIKIGADYIKTLADMEAQTMLTADATEELKNQFQEMGKDSTAGIKDTYAAYKALRDLGISHEIAMQKAVDVTKMARNESLDLAKAAKIAAFDTGGLTAAYLKLDEAMGGTAVDEWTRLKRTVTETIGEFYQTKDSGLAKMLKGFKDFLKKILPGLLKGLTALLIGFTVALSPLLLALGAIGAAIIGIGKLSSIVENMPTDKPKERFIDLFKPDKAIVKTEPKEITSGDITLSEKDKPTGIEPGHLIKPEAILKVNQTIYDKLHKTTSYYHEKEMDLIDLKVAAVHAAAVSIHTAAMAETGDTKKKLLAQAEEIQGYASLMRSVEVYAQEQHDLAFVYKGQAAFFQATGMLATKFHDKKAAQLKHEISLIQGLTDTEKKLYEETKQFKNEQAKLKPTMDAYAKSFALTGVMADAYYKNRIAQINEEIKQMKKKHLELDYELEMKLKLQALDRSKEAPVVAKHEAVFEKTGKMTEYLIKIKFKYETQDYEKDIKAHLDAVIAGDATEEDFKKYKIQRERQYQAEIINIGRQSIQGQLDVAQKAFDATGIASTKFKNLSIANMQLQKAAAITLYPEMADEINTTFRKMARDMVFKWEAPKLADWEKVYSKTGAMTNEFYDMRKKRINADYEDMAARLGESAELQEAYMRTLMELNIQKLESSDTVHDGIAAGFLRMYEQVEPLSKQIADDWIAGMGAMEQASKSLFFDVMEGNWENLESAAINVLDSIRDMFNEIVWDMIKSWTTSKLTEIIGKKLMDKIGGKDKTKEIAAQTAAITAQTAVLGVQSGVVAALTAEYWLLAMAMAACGMGGGGLGNNLEGGTGLGNLTSAQNAGSAFQHGGTIDELILGVGQKTGKRYSFGEHGTEEYVIPKDKMSDIKFQHGTRDDLILGAKYENTPKDMAKLSQIPPTINNTQSNTIEINIPVSVEGNNRLAGRIRTDVEDLVKEIMQEELR